MSDNKQILDKLTELEETVRTERNKANAGLKMTVLVYGLLVLIVIGYTTFIAREIKERAKPETVAVLLTTKIEEQIPRLEKYLKQNAKTESPVWAKKTVDYTMDIIPHMEGMAKQQLKLVVVKLMSRFKKEFFPNLVKFCKENLDSTFKNADVVSNKELAKALSGQLAAGIDKELDKVISDKFFLKVHDLRKEVDRVVGMKKKNMTKKELTEKRIILYWTFLVNHAEVGNSKFMDGIRFASMFMRAFEDLHINLDKESTSP